MTREQADRLAFALLNGMLWAVGGGKEALLPHVHEELSLALLPDEQSELSAESNLIKDAVIKCGGNVALAARQLGISRSTLYRWSVGRPIKGRVKEDAG